MISASEVILSARASKALVALEGSSARGEGSIARRTRALRTILLSDCLHGEVVRKGAIPRGLRTQYGLENLYVEDLPSFWRLLYTVVRREGRRMIVVVEIVDHQQYSRWFAGRGR